MGGGGGRRRGELDSLSHPPELLSKAYRGFCPQQPVILRGAQNCGPQQGSTSVTAAISGPSWGPLTQLRCPLSDQRGAGQVCPLFGHAHGCQWTSRRLSSADQVRLPRLLLRVTRLLLPRVLGRAVLSQDSWKPGPGPHLWPAVSALAPPCHWSKYSPVDRVSAGTLTAPPAL